MTKRRASSVPCRRRGYPGGWCADPKCRRDGKCLNAIATTKLFKQWARLNKKAVAR